MVLRRKEPESVRQKDFCTHALNLRRWKIGVLVEPWKAGVIQEEDLRMRSQQRSRFLCQLEIQRAFPQRTYDHENAFSRAAYRLWQKRSLREGNCTRSCLRRCVCHNPPPVRVGSGIARASPPPRPGLQRRGDGKHRADR